MQPQPGFILWLTGMGLTGKSTLGEFITPRLTMIGRKVEFLDHDDVAEILYKNSSFPDGSREALDVQVRRLGWLARLLSKQGTIAIVAHPSPYREVRDEQRRQSQRYAEVFVDCRLERLMERDGKGYIKKALAGELPNLIGVSAPFEPPNNPEIRVNTDTERVEESAARVFDKLLSLTWVNKKEHELLVGNSRTARPKTAEKLDPKAAGKKGSAKGEPKKPEAAADKAPDRKAEKKAAKAEPKTEPKAEKKAEKKAAKAEPKAEKKAEKKAAKAEPKAEPKAEKKAEKKAAKAEKKAEKKKGKK